MEFCRSLCCSRLAILVLVAFCVLGSTVEAHKLVGWVAPHDSTAKLQGRGLSLVTPQTVLTYHDGPLLTAGPVIPVFLVFYGYFTQQQKAIVLDFFKSFGLKAPSSKPSVRSWWSLTSGYKDTKGKSVAPSFSVAGQISYKASKTALTDHDIQILVALSLKEFEANPDAIYIVLTADEVQEENFCLNSCASHFVSNKTMTKGKVLPYIWAGNPGKQCPGLCAWPYAKPAYGPPNFTPLVSPNGDPGMDGLIINLASMLAGIATNPDDTGYYQGDAAAPLEAATACTGIYGAGAFPGDPGQLLTDKKSKASFNVYGANNREFLLPALWNPYTSLCTPP